MADIDLLGDAIGEKESRPPSPKRLKAPKILTLADLIGEGIEDESRLAILKSNFCPDGVDEVDLETWTKYYQQLEESEGFDIWDFPGVCMMTSIVPMTDTDFEDVLEEATAAINQFNDEQGTKYKFVKVEKANSQCWNIGMNSYITFQAADGAKSDTFQALVWVGPDWTYPALVVKFCRLKAAWWPKL